MRTLIIALLGLMLVFTACQKEVAPILEQDLEQNISLQFEGKVIDYSIPKVANQKDGEKGFVHLELDFDLEKMTDLIGKVQKLHLDYGFEGENQDLNWIITVKEEDLELFERPELVGPICVSTFCAHGFIQCVMADNIIVTTEILCESPLPYDEYEEDSYKVTFGGGWVEIDDTQYNISGAVIPVIVLEGN